VIGFGVMVIALRKMQTSFMHQAIRFALFYMRGGRAESRRRSRARIYWGAPAWVGLQVIMVVLVMRFPDPVTGRSTNRSPSI